MGAALADRRRDRTPGSQLEARAPARHASTPRRGDRTVVAAADEFAGDCTATRLADLDRDQNPEAARPQSPEGARSAGAGRALPAGTSGRVGPYGHQKAR